MTFYFSSKHYNYIPKKLSTFFMTVAQFASRPWGGFDVANVKKQYRYAFHNNRIPADSNGESSNDNGEDNLEEEDDVEDRQADEGDNANDE